jgi:hypothetical protein
MKLNLGCAKDVKEGWVNIDMHYDHPLVIKADILGLEYDHDSIEKIHAQDIIEHLPYQTALLQLSKWYNWLCKDGELFIQTTNFDKIIEAYRIGVWDVATLNYMLFAGINYTDVGSQECDFHKSVYSKDQICSHLQKLGFTIISVNEDVIDQSLLFNPKCHNLNIQILVKK